MSSDLQYLPPAQAIFVAGFMGTGKTTNGRRIARELGLRFVDTDEVVQAMAGKSIPDIFAQDGEAAFRDLETRALRQVIVGERAVVSTGGGIMLRPENVELMKSTGPIICFEAKAETILQRTGRREDRPLLQGEDPLTRIKSLLAERKPSYDQADYQVRADYEDRRILLRETIAALAQDPRSALMTSDRARVQVTAPNGEYHIHVQAGAFGRLGALCPAPREGVRCAVISTETVAGLYGDRVLESLRSGGWEPGLLTVPDGEDSKTLEVASGLYDGLIDLGVDSGGAAFALGGGVAGDLAGFVAATYRRGVRFAQLPTTLLAQVDASSGGKVAVNHPRGKNLIGAFYQPAGVVIDTETLATLPEREFRCGMAEVIKHAAIADANLFAFLEADMQSFRDLDELTVRYVLARNCQIKADVVQRDPYDRGLRACLNYGHTVGHAIERAADGWDVRHGEAVAIGMVAEARLALELGLCSEETVARQLALIQKAGLPIQAQGTNVEKAVDSLQLDKKIRSGRVALPIVPEIGKVKFLKDADVNILGDVLKSVIADPVKG